MARLADAPHATPDEISARLLRRACEEAARLLDADGAMAYLVDPTGERLQFAVDAGISSPEARDLLRDLQLPVGTGLFGTAVARGQTVVTDDYLQDHRFHHSEVADRIVAIVGMRSMAVAPLLAEGEVLGAMGAYSSRVESFDEAQIALLRALADHAATAIANARLIHRLARSEAELARRVEAQRTLGEISARIAAIHDPESLLQMVVDAAKRLLDTDGAHLSLHDEDAGLLRPTVIAGGTDPDTRDWLQGQEFPVGGGINGLAARDGVIIWTEDYLVDPRIPHEPDDQAVAQRMGLRGMAAAPMRAPDRGSIGTLAVSYEEPHAFSGDELELLQGLADQAAIAISNAELTARLRRQARELEHRVEAQHALSEIAAQIASIREPATVLQRAIDEGVRLLDADGGRIDLLDPSGGLHWAYGFGEIDRPIRPDTEETRPDGISGQAVMQREVRFTGDYLDDDSFVHAPEADAYVAKHQIRSVMSAPLIGETGPLGTLTVRSHRPNAFDGDGARLLRALADQAAIAVTNARLYDELRARIDAQRSLAAIAAEIAALRDPSAVIQRAADEAARLLGAESAMINPVASGAGQLEWAIAHVPADEVLDDVVVPEGVGISGLALRERRVAWTGDYHNDESFAHAPELDEYIGRRGMRSVMSAPLIGSQGPIGTLTVQSARPHAFGPPQAELLEMLAIQAAVTIANARLYDELQESERRYRFLVDNSPDIVWSVDAEGRFTFFSESLESRTGWRPDQLLGRSFVDLADATSRPVAAAGFRRLLERPDEEQRIRIDMPLADGRLAPSEITMIGAVVDGAFRGAHGSVRDVSERERLERDLRRQTAELAAGQERAHLARELHDSVTQALFSMGLTTRSLELLLDTAPSAARQKLTELRELQKDALAEMRTLIFELRPHGLKQDGLVQALRNQAAAVEGRTGLSVTVEAIDQEARLPLEVEEALYRIAQEALHNVVKHASAATASIRFAFEEGMASLSVGDDGAGFDPLRVPRGHLGLVGMRQRVDRFGGELAIESRAGGGTTVSVEIPIPDESGALSAE